MEANKEEEKWIARLRKTLIAAPEGVWLFVAEGQLHVMRKLENNRALAPDGYVDRQYSIDTCSASHLEIDGGQW